jgi:hypothetical protein
MASPHTGDTSNNGHSQGDIDRLTGADLRLEWQDYDLDEQLEIILNNAKLVDWYHPDYLETLTFFRKDPRAWGQVKARFQELKGFPPDLEKAVDMQLKIDLSTDTDTLPRTYRAEDCAETSHANSNTYPLTAQWPTLAPEAYHGLLGEIVEKLKPHTEADPVAIAGQFLVQFGVVIGRKSYYRVEASRHYTNLFLAVVGATSKARKGTSGSHVHGAMSAADGTWTLDNIISACGSGEAIVWAVRDGDISDKRLLIAEEEFSSVLKVCSREGNILSDTIRKAWDSGSLRNQVKGNPLKATDAHIGLIGHITMSELTRLITATDQSNGFGNRFLWLAVRRSQLLPDGGSYTLADDAQMVKRLHDVIDHARTVEAMQRDETAKAAWRAVYPLLTRDREGLAGAMADRAEAQVLRLSMLYALLDSSATIRLEHLLAALALWRYSEECVSMIFGQSSGDPIAETILEALKSAGPDGLSRKFIIEEVFQRHTKADKINTAICSLLASGRITIREIPTAGRKKEVLSYNPNSELSELSEQRVPDYCNVAKIKALEDQYSLRAKCEQSASKVHSPTLNSHLTRKACEQISPLNSNGYTIISHNSHNSHTQESDDPQYTADPDEESDYF